MVASLLAAFVGGYTAARLSGRPKMSTGAWHGLTAWSVSTLIVLYLLTTAVGGLLGGVFGTISSSLGGLGQAAASAASPALSRVTDPVASIEQQLNATGTDPASVKDAATAAVKALVTGDPAQATAARENAAQAVSKSQSIPIETARTRVAQVEKQYRDNVDQAKQQAMKAADVTGSVVSKAALYGFLALALGSLAASIGGRLGTVEPTLTGAVTRQR